MRAQLFGVVLLVACPLFLTSMLSRADDGKKAEDGEVEDNPPPEVAKAMAAADDALTAYALVDYGRSQKYPEALLTAVRMLHHLPARPAGKELEAVAADKDQPAPAAVRMPEQQLADLIQEARAMRPKDKLLDAIADRLSEEIKEESRAVVGGPTSRIVQVPRAPHGSSVLRFTWTPGKTKRTEGVVIASALLSAGPRPTPVVVKKIFPPKKGVQVPLPKPAPPPGRLEMQVHDSRGKKVGDSLSHYQRNNNQITVRFPVSRTETFTITVYQFHQQPTINVRVDAL